MFYGLNNISDHPCFKMQEVINSLLWATVNDIPFGPNIFPAWFNKTYVRASAVQKNLRDMHANLLKVNIAVRKEIYSQFVNNNAIKIICDDTGYSIESTVNWKVSPGKDLKELIITLYDKLDLAVFKIEKCKQKPLHRYYSDFIKANSYVCPFCFINQYKNRLTPKREDFDHYFCKSIYPLSAANMENLVPMCGECNQTYKRESKVAEDIDGRVAAFYPYSDIPEVELIISCNQYPSLEDVNDNGTWTVELNCSDLSQQDKVENWDRVFGIRNRIAGEIAEFHQQWVQRSLRLDNPELFPDLVTFREYLQSVSDREFEESVYRMEPKTLLKASLFHFLSADADDVFLKSFMRQYDAEKVEVA